MQVFVSCCVITKRIEFLVRIGVGKNLIVESLYYYCYCYYYYYYYYYY